MKRRKYITPATEVKPLLMTDCIVAGSPGTYEAFAKQFDPVGFDFDETEDKEWSMWTYQPFEDLAEDNSKTY